MDMDKIRAKQQVLAKERDTSEGNGKYKLFIPLEGDNKIRILPPIGDNDVFYVEFKTHFGIGPNKKTVVCPKSFDVKAKCPACDISNELYKTKEEEDKVLATAIRAKTRFRVNIINLDKTEDGVQIYEFGQNLMKDLLIFVVDPDYGDITDLKTGRDITIKRVGKGKDTRYTIIPRPVASELAAEVLTLANDLQESVKASDADYIERVLNGEEDDEKAETESKPAAAALNGAAVTGVTVAEAAVEPAVTIPASQADILARLKQHQKPAV